MPTAIPSDSDAARRRLREMIAEDETSTDFEPADIDRLLAGAANLEEAAAAAWRRKAAKYAELTDVAESGSSRKLGDLHKNALAMFVHYDERSTDEPAPGEAVGTRVRPIERP
jgi:hypothetical protein